MTEPDLIDAWCDRLRQGIPGAVAVILKGSEARGDAGPWSDVDFDVLVADGTAIAHPYLTWIEPDDSGRLVHVSVAVDPESAWFEGMAEAAGWSFGLPAREATRLVWSVDELRVQLDHPYQAHPAGEPELEDTIECLQKARNACERGDEVTMRLHLHDMAALVPSLLVPINPAAVVGTRPEALQAALEFPVAPPGYRENLLACLGFGGEAEATEDILASGEHLVLGILALLQQHADVVCPLLPPELDMLLGTGRIRQYLEQGRLSSQGDSP